MGEGCSAGAPRSGPSGPALPDSVALRSNLTGRVNPFERPTGAPAQVSDGLGGSSALARLGDAHEAGAGTGPHEGRLQPPEVLPDDGDVVRPGHQALDEPLAGAPVLRLVVQHEAQ